MSDSRNYDVTMEPPEVWAVETIEAVFELNAALLTEFDRLTAGSALTPPIARALWALDPADGPLPRRKLAERLGCDPSNVTWLADRLEEQNLLTRVPDHADRRVRALTLTNSGQTLRKRLARALAAAMQPGGVASRELAQLTQLLQARSPAVPARAICRTTSTTRPKPHDGR